MLNSESAAPGFWDDLRSPKGDPQDASAGEQA